LDISNEVSIPDDEIQMHAIRARGAGGQNVNKVSSAIHLRFDIRASSLPAFCKQRLLAQRDERISGEGVIVIKAQHFRSQKQNREDALSRLLELIKSATHVPRKRRPTRQLPAAKKRRLDSKTKRGQLKSLRGKVTD